jgi:hypothetical protein
MEQQVHGIIVERKVFSRKFLILLLSLYVAVVRLDVQHHAGVHNQYANSSNVKGFPYE